LARLESLTLRSSPSGDTKIELISPSTEKDVAFGSTLFFALPGLGWNFVCVFVRSDVLEGGELCFT
jgi:hypothetical protein